MFNEPQTGFLAGYAAVMDGNTHLAFMGGMAVPIVVQRSIGYIAGAYYAAHELGVDIYFTDEEYFYTGSFAADDYTLTDANYLYSGGTEVIYTVNGGGIQSVISSAEYYDTWVIGTDVDQSDLSEQILTSSIRQFDIVI